MERIIEMELGRKVKIRRKDKKERKGSNVRWRK